MKASKIVSLVFGGLVLATSGNAAAEETGKMYITGTIGMVMPNDTDGSSSGTAYTIEMQDSAYFSAALGYHASENVRVEGEVGYSNSGWDSISGNGVTVDLNGDVDLLTFTAAGYYDIKTSSSITPYVGAGAGLVRWDQGTVTASLNGTSVSASGSSGTDLTAFGEVGASVEVSDGIAFVPAYRLLWLDTGGNGLDDTTAHVFKAGLRFDFQTRKAS